MIDANGEESDSDGEREATQPPVECPAHKNKTTKTKFMMSDEEVVANSIGFLFAGNETTAITLSFTSYELALNPDIQEKLQSEIDAYYEDKPVSYYRSKAHRRLMLIPCYMGWGGGCQESTHAVYIRIQCTSQHKNHCC
jgi:hypothetical protein